MSDSGVRLSLSAKGLQRLETAQRENDFAFIVGDERYSCPSFVAEFLSPRVTSLRSQDITIDEFCIATEDPSHSFRLFLSIGFGGEVSLTETQLGFVRSVCGELWNSELFEKTLKQGEGELKAQLQFLSGINGSCEMEVRIVASRFHELSVSDFDELSPSVLEAILSDPRLVVRDEDSVFQIVHRRASTDLSYFGLLEFVRFEFVSGECMKTAFDFISSSFDSITVGIWSSLQTRLTVSVTPPSQTGRFKSLPALDSKTISTASQIDSRIISAIPEIFSVFGGKKLQLLYRGSRDGFQGSTFHARCDGHLNTVTLISSTNNCIFGGYTPVAWGSRSDYVPDPSLASFIFTIKNPHNLPARIFKLKVATHATYHRADYGPTFGVGHDIHVCNECNCYNSYSNCHGHSYTYDTGIGATEILTGARYFTVKEIEVFEVI
jgi:hypothetical protein